MCIYRNESWSLFVIHTLGIFNHLLSPFVLRYIKLLSISQGILYLSFQQMWSGKLLRNTINCFEVTFLTFRRGINVTMECFLETFMNVNYLLLLSCTKACHKCIISCREWQAMTHSKCHAVSLSCKNRCINNLERSFINSNY